MASRTTADVDALHDVRRLHRLLRTAGNHPHYRWDPPTSFDTVCQCGRIGLFLKGRSGIFSFTKIAQIFYNILKSGTFRIYLSAGGTLRATFGQNWATFYSHVWSHWFVAKIFLLPQIRSSFFIKFCHNKRLSSTMVHVQCDQIWQNFATWAKF